MSTPSPDSARHPRHQLYGDGIFETVLLHHGRIPLLPWHWQRLSAGAALLGMHLPAGLQSQTQFAEGLLAAAQPHGPYVRVRLALYRLGGYGYASASSQAGFDIAAFPLAEDPFTPGPAQTLAVLPEAWAAWSPVSHLKSLSALKYVLAANQAAALGTADAILLTAEGLVAETTRAALVWQAGGQLYTPVLSAGCIASVALAALQTHVPIEPVAAHWHGLKEADALITLNAVAGPQPVEALFSDGKNWHTLPGSVLLAQQLHAALAP